MKKRLRIFFSPCCGWRILRVSLAVLLLVLPGAMAWGKVAGPCVNCHTMHNSQDGSSVVDSNIGVQPALTTSNCVGCHSNDSETIKNLGGGALVPVVYTMSAPNLVQGTPTSMLAGGNFHWVANGDDTKGHNVFGLSAPDGNLDRAPGEMIGGGNGESNCNNCHGSLSTPASGCKGCHLPAHHADDSAIVVDAAHGSYRFLGDVMGAVDPPNYPQGTVGVKGIEDPDWEQTVSKNDHNVYSGQTELYSKGLNSPPNLGSIGQMCAGCHGDFHDAMNTGQEGAGNTVSGAWIRHPSDVLIPNEGEYAAYTEYNPLAPVAKVDLVAGMENTPIVTPGADVVTCISCHRPHGSPYPDMLRWNYDSCVAGTESDECGCYVCHTTKD